jgi:glutathione S-transferase
VGRHGQGIGRLEPEEKQHLVKLGVNAVADILGDSAYLFGPHPSAADATAYGFLARLESRFFDTPYGELVRDQSILAAYLFRIAAEYSSDHHP